MLADLVFCNRFAAGISFVTKTSKRPIVIFNWPVGIHICNQLSQYHRQSRRRRQVLNMHGRGYNFCIRHITSTVLFFLRRHLPCHHQHQPPQRVSTSTSSRHQPCQHVNIAENYNPSFLSILFTSLPRNSTTQPQSPTFFDGHCHSVFWSAELLTVFSAIVLNTLTATSFRDRCNWRLTFRTLVRRSRTPTLVVTLTYNYTARTSFPLTTPLSSFNCHSACCLRDLILRTIRLSAIGCDPIITAV